MIGWFIAWLQRFVQLGLDLAFQLVKGLFRAPFVAAVRAGEAPIIRRGTAADVIDLRHRVLRAGRPRADAIFPGDDDPQTRHWVASRAAADREVIVGVVSVMAAVPSPPIAGLSPRWQLRGMAVDEPLRGLGIGEQLLAAVHREVGEPMWCNARAGVVGFYERSGWRVCGPPFDVQGIGPHRQMVWENR